MAEVQGIGGVFFESNDANRLAGWYETVLGIPMEAHPDGIGYYHVFTTRDAETGAVRENPVLAINHAAAPVATTDRGFTLNLRVDDLHAMLDRLRAAGVEVEAEVLEWSRGRHGWIRDLDGNRVELYEEVTPTRPEDA